jgi:photosystem II stability/assembly factor-like uncharacterized protein
MKFLKTVAVFAIISSLAIFSQEDNSESKLKSSTFSGLKLRSIGPATTGGRISDLAVDPENRSRFFVAVASGGVFRTTNGGLNFDAVFENEDVYSIGCVTIDPNNSHTVWVGTGENNSQRSVAWGDGVYKSVDGGSTWKNMGLKNSEHIGKIIVHPENSDVVYVASQGPLWGPGGDRGLYKTTDGGETWELSLEISENTGVSDIVMDPRNPDVIYASAYQRRRHVWTLINGGPESAIYKTTDGGKTWNKLTRGLPGGDVGRIGLAISPQKPDVLYAIIELPENDGGFWKSTDRGASWKKQSNYVSNSPQYYNEIVCDPVEFDLLYSLDTYTRVSSDGGKNWERLSLKERHVDDHALYIDPDDNNYLLIGGDGGLYESFDKGSTWRFFPNMSLTQFYRIQADNSEPFYYVYGGTQDNNSLGGPSRTRNSNGILNMDWYWVVGGDGYEPRVDPENPNIVYAQWQYGNLIRFDRLNGEITGIQPQPEEGEELRWNWDTPLIISPHSNTTLYFAANKLFKSTDRGDSWIKISEDLTRQIPRNELPVMDSIWPPEAVAKNQSTSIYGNIISLDESPVQKGLVYVGTDDGLIQVTEDDGANWNKISKFANVPETTYVADIFASRHDANVVYAVFNNHKNADFKPYVAKSTDKGKTWVSISSNIPDNEPAWTIEEDTENPNLLFVGTEFSLYFTIDGGKNWIEHKPGMPTIAVRDLDIQERESDLVVGTFGRGIYILDDYSALRTVNEELFKNEAHIFPIKDALMYHEHSFKNRRNEGETYFMADNPPYGATFTYYLKESYKSKKQERQKKWKEITEAGGTPVYPSFEDLRKEDLEAGAYLIFTIKDSQGNTIRQLKGSASPGISRMTWDLRFPSYYPVSKSTDVNKHSGMPVLPGTYSVEISKNIDGEITKIAGPENFEVKMLDGRSIPVEDKDALQEFRDKVLALQAATNSASQMLSEMKERTGLLAKSIKNTRGGNIEMLSTLRDMEYQLEEFHRRLLGDASISKRAANQTPAISDRIGYIVFIMWYNNSAPTKTNMDSYSVASRQLEALIADMKTLYDTQLLPMQNQLKDLNAPWVPGTFPEWKHR